MSPFQKFLISLRYDRYINHWCSWFCQVPSLATTFSKHWSDVIILWNCMLRSGIGCGTADFGKGLESGRRIDTSQYHFSSDCSLGWSCYLGKFVTLHFEKQQLACLQQAHQSQDSKSRLDGSRIAQLFDCFRLASKDCASIGSLTLLEHTTSEVGVYPSSKPWLLCIRISR